MPRKPTGRKSTRAGFLEAQWQPVFEQLDSAHVRRAKSLCKQGGVLKLTVRDRRMHAQVRVQNGTGAGHGTVRVTVPCFDWWAPFTKDISLWLSRRPDWLAALYARVWEPELFEFIAAAGLKLAPSAREAERILSDASCTCKDIESPCRHVLAVVFQAIFETESDPIRGLTLVGVSPETLFTDIKHRAYAAVMDSGHALVRASKNSGAEVGSSLYWPEEKTVFSEPIEPVNAKWTRIRPDVDESRLSQYLRGYMAWD